MKTQAASTRGWGRPSCTGTITLAFLGAAQRLAICRAARDAHRAACFRDALECPVCQEHARIIAHAKGALREECG